jgi:hypothetical protein
MIWCVISRCVLHFPLRNPNYGFGYERLEIDYNLIFSKLIHIISSNLKYKHNISSNLSLVKHILTIISF